MLRRIILGSFASVVVISEVNQPLCDLAESHQLPSRALLQISRASLHQNKTADDDDEDAQNLTDPRIQDFYDEILDSVESEPNFVADDDPPDTNLQLVHITKTGGTALEAWGLQNGFSWGYFWDEMHTLENGSPFPDEAWHTPPRYFQKNPYDGHELFAVVRDPYMRMISEFRCPFSGYFRGNQSKRAEAGVNDLNAWIVEKLSDGAARPPFSGVHMIPQYMYIFAEDWSRHINPENVLRLDELDRHFADLLERHGISGAQLERINDSEMTKFGVIDLWEDTRKLIEQEYGEDFKQFGYEKL